MAALTILVAAAALALALMALGAGAIWLLAKNRHSPLRVAGVLFALIALPVIVAVLVQGLYVDARGAAAVLPSPTSSSSSSAASTSAAADSAASTSAASAPAAASISTSTSTSSAAAVSAAASASSASSASTASTSASPALGAYEQNLARWRTDAAAVGAISWEGTTLEGIYARREPLLLKGTPAASWPMPKLARRDAAGAAQAVRAMAATGAVLEGVKYKAKRSGRIFRPAPEVHAALPVSSWPFHAGSGAYVDTTIGAIIDPHSGDDPTRGHAGGRTGGHTGGTSGGTRDAVGADGTSREERGEERGLERGLEQAGEEVEAEEEGGYYQGTATLRGLLQGPLRALVDLIIPRHFVKPINYFALPEKRSEKVGGEKGHVVTRPPGTAMLWFGSAGESISYSISNIYIQYPIFNIQYFSQ